MEVTAFNLTSFLDSILILTLIFGLYSDLCDIKKHITFSFGIIGSRLAWFHKWVVFSASIFVSFLNYGFTVSMGAMFRGILDTFNAGRAKSALVQSLLIASIWGLGVVSGFLISKFGISTVTYISATLTAIGFLASYFATSIYQLYGFISFVTGVGIATIAVSAVMCVGWTFIGRQKLMVLAVQSVGTALSGFMWPHLLTASIASYGLRGTCLILCGMFLNNVVAAIIFSNCEINPEVHKMTNVKQGEINKGFEEINWMSKADSQKSVDPIVFGRPGTMNKITRHRDTNVTLTYFRKSDKSPYNEGNIDGVIEINSVSASKTESGELENFSPGEKRFDNKTGCVYAIYVIAGVFNMSTLAGFLTVYQDINLYHGLTISQSDITFTSYALLNVLSRFLPIIPAKFSNLNSFIVPVFSSLFGVVGQLILLTNKSFTATIIAMSFTAVSDGGCISSMQAILFEILPRKHQPLGYGFMLTALGVGSAATGPLFGHIRDESSSYQLMLVLTALLLSLSAILDLVCLLISRKSKQ